jgi:hypothetical protein
VQFIFAGKAHPRDDDGKRYIQHIIHLSRFSDLKGHLVFIENYDVHVARQMVSGCDVWLNNPRRPLEASGTSGMKAGCHGCLNLSILDGWWREGYDGDNGFAIGEDSHPDSVEEQDRTDSANLYKVLTEEVIPCFFDRDAQGIPRRWLQKIRHAMVTLVPQFHTGRVVQEYTEKYYLTKWRSPLNLTRNLNLDLFGLAVASKIKRKIKIKMEVTPDIKSQTREELAARFADWKQPATLRNCWNALRTSRDRLEAMSNLPALRPASPGLLAARAGIG